MTTGEVCKRLRVVTKTVYRMHADGRLVGIRTADKGSPLRFRRSEVEAFLARQTGK